MDLFGWDAEDEDLLFGQVTSLSGQFAPQWRLRVMAREAVLEGVVNSELRRILAYDKPFYCADVYMGDSALVY